ncbi:unnamed protein product [Durusdinium trenchii]|uniref:Alpha-1,6-mannosyl-glycoprotein 6-beta-N-acetylglucosaminyltransferase n=1 Tax=Durusdinium trenchii TaxID=1381693 RepID=A0ABP0L024_9DINO
MNGKLRSCKTSFETWGDRPDPFLFLQHPLCDVPVVQLNDLDRLTEKRYKRLFFIDWPGEGLLKSKLLTSLQSLLDGKVNSGGPFRLVYRNQDLETDTTFKVVAQFFGLWPQLPIRGAYMGVLRLRWRDTVLFVVPSSSLLGGGPFREALLRPEEDAVHEAVMPVVPGQVVDPMLFPLSNRPVLLPAGAELLGADLPGTSCDAVCEEAGLECHPEDLPFINSCRALEALNCRRCEADEGPDQPAQEVQGARAGRCLYNGNLGRFPLACGASHVGTRRLCVCRERIALAAVAQTTEATSTERPKAPVLEAPVTAPPALDALLPQNLAVLVLASGLRPRSLERSLQSLSQAYGYNKHMVFVSQDGDGDQAKITAQKFRVGWQQVDTGVKSAGEKEALHYKLALEHVVSAKGPFRDKPALVILEEDVVVSYDILLYFGQLQAVLQWEDIFSVSAWNENALGPYSSDPHRLLRVDAFSSVAWMVSTEHLVRSLLPQWPRNFWQKHWRRSSFGRKQHIIPEMPRVRVERAQGTPLSSMVVPTSFRDNLALADLGDLHRLSSEAYSAKLVEELRSATLVEDLRVLPSPLKLKEEQGSEVSNWRIHYESAQPESDGTWSVLARFLQLPEGTQPPLLQGVIKIPWGGRGRSVKSSPSMLVTSLPRRGGPWRRSAAKAALVLAKKIEDPVGIQVSQVRYFPGPDVTWHLHNSVEPITLMFGTWIPGRECEDPTLRSVADRTPFVRCGISRSWELVSGSYSGLATGSGRVHEVVQVPRARAPWSCRALGFSALHVHLTFHLTFLLVPFI